MPRCPKCGSYVDETWSCEVCEWNALHHRIAELEAERDTLRDALRRVVEDRGDLLTAIDDAAKLLPATELDSGGGGCSEGPGSSSDLGHPSRASTCEDAGE